MAIYHLSVQVISRGQGKSCIAAAAYRAGEKLYDERQEISHDYTKKSQVESEIMTPENAPAWATNREKLWNEVDRAETRCNSRTAREINIALPLELSKDQQKELIREYVKENFVNKGMVADVCFHFNDINNPHCHVMLTTREIAQEGFTKKNRDWDKKENVEEWREQWANHANRALEKADCQERIDNRSYKEQGIDQLPTIHLGKTASEMQSKGIENERVKINEEIKKLNKEKIIALQEYRELKDKLNQEKEKEAKRYDNLMDDERAALKKAETLLKGPLTMENSNKALNALKDMREENMLKRSEMDSAAREVERRINGIKYNLELLRKAENEFKELPKNLFGQYKNKSMAESLKSSIDRYNKELVRDGYRSSADINLQEQKLENIRTGIKELDNKVSAINRTINSINQGVKALQNKEIREFYKEYKEYFPQAKYLKYSEMKAIKAANELLGRPVSFEETKELYNKSYEKLNDIDKELRSIEDNSRRLQGAKESLETIEKYKDIAEKWDTKVFGKAKFQEEHKYEKWQYDKAVNAIKEYGVKDKIELRQQERIQENCIKEVQPKLQAQRVTISPAMNILQAAIRAFDNASREEKYDRNKAQSRHTKAFKGRHREDEFEYSR